MALIICPECGKEISDKCEICMYCGFPIINTKCNIDGVIYDLKDELPIVLSGSVHAIGKIRKKTFLTLDDTDDLIDIIQKTGKIPENFTPQYPLEKRKTLYGHSNNSNVECPYCHSTYVNKITLTSKVINTVVWGIFGTKRHRQWHCNQCNSDF